MFFNFVNRPDEMDKESGMTDQEENEKKENLPSPPPIPPGPPAPPPPPPMKVVMPSRAGLFSGSSNMLGGLQFQLKKSTKNQPQNFQERVNLERPDSLSDRALMGMVDSLNQYSLPDDEREFLGVWVDVNRLSPSSSKHLMLLAGGARGVCFSTHQILSFSTLASECQPLFDQIERVFKEMGKEVSY